MRARTFILYSMKGSPFKKFGPLFLFLFLSLASISTANASFKDILGSNIFNKNEIYAGYYDNDIMHFHLYHPPSPIFWSTSLKVDQGWILGYERNIYHTQKYLSVNLGGNLSRWEKNKESLSSISTFLALRFWPIHFSFTRPYLLWSIAGPTYMSKHSLGGKDLGENFIFQDHIGGGIMLGENHAVDLSVRIYHYSNGDLFVDNPGFEAPVIVSLGFAF